MAFVKLAEPTVALPKADRARHTNNLLRTSDSRKYFCLQSGNIYTNIRPAIVKASSNSLCLMPVDSPICDK